MAIIIVTIIIGSFNVSYCINEDWSAQAIADFLYNEVDAPDVLKDQTFPYQRGYLKTQIQKMF